VSKLHRLLLSLDEADQAADDRKLASCHKRKIMLLENSSVMWFKSMQRSDRLRRGVISLIRKDPRLLKIYGRNLDRRLID
jgi:hypothetical protein